MSYKKLDVLTSSPEVELSNYNLSSGADSEVEVLSGPCDGRDRTYAIYIGNKTQWTIDVLMFQLKSTIPARPGYVTDTGTFVAASKMGPGGSDTVDPCELGKGAIFGTWGQYAVKAYIDWHGKRYHQDYVRTGSAAAGKYWRELKVEFVEKPAAANSDLPPGLEMMVEERE